MDILMFKEKNWRAAERLALVWHAAMKWQIDNFECLLFFGWDKLYINFSQKHMSTNKPINYVMYVHDLDGYSMFALFL